MKNKKIVIPLILTVAATIVVLFQNCGKMQSIGGSSSQSSFWFDYAYDEKPSVYSELYFYRPKNSGNNGLYNYTFLGSVAPSEDLSGTTPPSYSITFKDQNNQTVCPTITGNTSSIHSSCVGVIAANKVTVKMTVTYNGEQKIFEKTF